MHNFSWLVLTLQHLLEQVQSNLNERKKKDHDYGSALRGALSLFNSVVVVWFGSRQDGVLVASLCCCCVTIAS